MRFKAVLDTPVIDVLVTELEGHIVDTFPRLDLDTESGIVASVAVGGGRLHASCPFDTTMGRANFWGILVREFNC